MQSPQSCEIEACKACPNFSSNDFAHLFDASATKQASCRRNFMCYEVILDLTAGLQRSVRPSKSSVFSSEEDAIYPPNATGFNLQMAKHKAVANVTHVR